MGRHTPPYVAVEPWIWNDPRVRKLGRDARGLFALLMTFPGMTKVPGLIFAGVGALMDEWQSKESELKEAFAELETAELCVADWSNRIVYVIPLLREMVCNAPNGPPRAAAYGTVILRLAPDCALVRRIEHDVMQLMLGSPAMKASFLSCHPKSDEDAQRMAGRPLAAPPRQLGLPLQETGAPAAARGASAEPAAPTEGVPAGDSVPPDLRVIAGGDPDAELEAGVQELVARAGAVLALPAGQFTPMQSDQLRENWKLAFAAGRRRGDLADLGTWVARHDWATLKMPVATYVCSFLDDCLTKMDQRRPKAHTAVRAGPPTARGVAGLHWSMDGSGRPAAAYIDGGEGVACILDDEWEIEQMTQVHKRWLACDPRDPITLQDVRAALAPERRPSPAALTAEGAAILEVLRPRASAGEAG